MYLARPVLNIHLSLSLSLNLFLSLACVLALALLLQGVVNRDIKLENTLIDPTLNEDAPTIKICDFGLSKDEKVRGVTLASPRPREVRRVKKRSRRCAV
jgi:serine/threonine protein kinase